MHALFFSNRAFLGKWVRRRYDSQAALVGGNMVESSDCDQEREIGSSACEAGAKPVAEAGKQDNSYESPCVMVLGSVRDLTVGSSASGKKDANSQYYW